MSTSFRTPFVVVGTGRCGTTSIAKILNACKNAEVYHEAHPLLWYGVDGVLGDLTKRMREAGKNGVLFGEVGQSVAPSIAWLRDSFPGMPVVCLHRDKAGTVKSFLNHGLDVRPTNKRNTMDRARNDRMSRQVHCVPTIDAYSNEQAIGFYWEFYEAIMAGIKPPVFHINMLDLNDNDCLSALFEFLGIPEEDRVYIEKRQFHTAEEVSAKREHFRRLQGA
jgi:hypothetical protein